jgi:hypothetical protein
MFFSHDLALIVKKNYKVKFLTISILKKIKSLKIILEKNHNKKTMCRNTVAIHGVL